MSYTSSYGGETLHLSDAASDLPTARVDEIVDGIPYQEDVIAYLDAIALSGEHGTQDARAVAWRLLGLPHDGLFDTYGRDAALWAMIVASAENGSSDTPRETALQRRFGIDLASFFDAQLFVEGRQARDVSRRNPQVTAARDVIAQYNFVQRLKNDELLSQIDLPRLVTDSATNTIDGRRAESYRLEVIEPSSYSAREGGPVTKWRGSIPGRPDISYPVYLDAPRGFVLMYKDMPHAIGGVAMRSADTLMIDQIQGVRGIKVDPAKYPGHPQYEQGLVSARGLAPLDWKRLIVSIAESLAQSTGATQTGIQAAHNNKWTQRKLIGKDEMHFPPERARMTYDDTAARLGYAQDADRTHDWFKRL